MKKRELDMYSVQDVVEDLIKGEAHQINSSRKENIQEHDKEISWDNA